MKWNDNSKWIKKGDHAFLSPSKYHWINYDPEKMMQAYFNHVAAQKGVELHDFADRCIKLRQKLPRKNQTLNMYVNDAIGFGLTSEVPLFYSENCFGTADSIGFRKKILRIHDLKTGVTPASLHQLEVYAALFCLEYKIKPHELEGCELRIYQNNDVLIGQPDPETLLKRMDTIVYFDSLINDYKFKYENSEG